MVVLRTEIQNRARAASNYYPSELVTRHGVLPCLLSSCASLGLVSIMHRFLEGMQEKFGEVRDWGCGNHG